MWVAIKAQVISVCVVAVFRDKFYLLMMQKNDIFYRALYVKVFVINIVPKTYDRDKALVLFLSLKTYTVFYQLKKKKK